MDIAGIRKASHQIDKIRCRPGLIARITQGYFRTQVLRQTRLRICEFSITPDCQSECIFCYASKFRKEGENLLSTEEIAATWDQAKKMGAFSAILLGGEPLLHPEFMDIIRILEPRKHIITFATNAIALTEDLVRELKDMGVFLIYLSFNSLNAEVNDELRGHKGHYDCVMNAIEICQRYGIDICFPVATSKPNLQDTYEIVRYAKQIHASVTVNLMCAMGRTEGELDTLFDEEFWQEFRQMVNSNPHMRADYDVNLSLRIGCPAGYEKIHISPYGEVTGCSMQPNSFGSIREEPLEQIVQRMRRFHHFAKRAPHCLVAVDLDYIKDYMNFSVNYTSIPYPVEKNPHYERDKG